MARTPKVGDQQLDLPTTCIAFGNPYEEPRRVDEDTPLPVIVVGAAGGAVGTTYVDNAVGQSVDVNVVAEATLPAATSRSGTITTGNTSQTLAAANAARRGLRIQNISAGSLGVNELGAAAAIGTAGTYTLATGETLEVLGQGAVTVVGATIGQAFTAVEI